MPIGVEKHYTEEMKADIDFNTGTLAEVLEDVESLETKGVFTYLNAGGEQTVFDLIEDTKRSVYGIMCDMTTITQNGIFKLYAKIDDTNFREIDSQVFNVATDSDGLLFNFKIPISENFKLTYTEDSDEGADRAIPYRFLTQDA